MPDLMSVPFQECESASHWEIKVTGSHGDTYTVSYGPTPGGEYEYGWRCTCLGFKWKQKKCRHIKEVESKRCGWMQFIDGGEADDGLCPECGGPITTRLWAV